MLELLRLHQPLPFSGMSDPKAALTDSLAAVLRGQSLAAQRIAVAVGSRGIDSLPLLVSTTVEALRARGALPFIVPAMGSHGAATAEGQAAVLARLGVSEATCGAEVVSTLETVTLGQTPSGLAVHLDAAAAAADGIVLLNRVKPHTSFSGRYESGLVKQLVVGLGNHAGAAEAHRRGVPGLAAAISEIGAFALIRAPILCGVALVEDGYGAPAALEAIPAGRLLQREPELLDLAKELLPRLPFDDLDVLIVEQIGKDISGTGMDPNVIGRRRIPGVPEPATPRIETIVVLDLSEATHGQGLGIGLADITTARAVEKLDPAAMYTNALTTGILSRVMIPLTCPDEATAIETALGLVRGKPPEAVRVARIRDTKHLESIAVSPALLDEALARGLVR